MIPSESILNASGELARDHLANFTASAARGPASRTSVWSAAGCSATLILLTLFLLPDAAQPLPALPAFLPMFSVFVFAVDGITAYLLWIQFYNDRDAAIGGLACAYGFVAPVAILQLLVFPGVLSPTGLFNPAPSTAVWLWVIWHGGFPTIIFLAMMAKHFRGDRALTERVSTAVFWSCLAVPATLLVLAAWITIGHGESLPNLLSGNSYSSLASSPAGLYVSISNFTAVAAILFVGRGKNPLYLWTTVAVVAALCDATLTLAGGARFSLGWYASRSMSVVAATTVLMFSLLEATRLYVRLASANAMLRQAATRDGLTGVANRRAFDFALESELRRVGRNRQSLSLIMLDVDHFKLYNDHFGHVAGDECLKAIAACMTAVLRRPADLVARYGGEEFAVILPQTDSVGARQLAEEIRLRIQEMAIAAAPNPIGLPFVSASLGVSTTEVSVGSSTMVASADAALYQAKLLGRNQVKSATELGLASTTLEFGAAMNGGISGLSGSAGY